MNDNPEIKSNVLYYGDNLIHMQNKYNFPDNSVDLIYVDSDFSPGKIYTYDEKSQEGHKNTWNDGTESYIKFMTLRLQEVYRILSKRGTVYIHCDYHAYGQLKILMDKIIQNDIEKLGKYQTTIVWQRGSIGIGARINKIFPEVSDYILVYSKGDPIYNTQYIPRDTNFLNTFENPDNDPDGAYKWYGYNKDRSPTQETLKANEERIKSCGVGFLRKNKNRGYEYKRYLNDNYDKDGKLLRKGMNSGTPISNIWTDLKTNKSIQKPEKLMERIILASSNIDSVVLDPFCGSGTTIFVAKKYFRKFIGIDYSSHAIHLSAKRLYYQESKIEGMPKISIQIPEIEKEIVDIKGITKLEEEKIRQINDVNDTIRVLQDYRSPFKNIIRESNIQREEAAALSIRFDDVIAEEKINDSRPDITRTISKIAIEEKNKASYWDILVKIGKYLDYVNYKYVIFSLHNMKGSKEDFERVKSQLRLQLKKEHQKNIYFIDDSEFSIL